MEQAIVLPNAIAIEEIAHGHTLILDENMGYKNAVRDEIPEAKKFIACKFFHSNRYSYANNVIKKKTVETGSRTWT